jgi:hypothetical protein
VRRADLHRPLAGSDQLVAELLNPRLNVGLDALGSLVLGDRAQHLLQAIEALARLARRAEGLLSLLVFR